jgi:hypothetical protein
MFRRNSVCGEQNVASSRSGHERTASGPGSRPLEGGGQEKSVGDEEGGKREGKDQGTKKNKDMKRKEGSGDTEKEDKRRM